MEWAFGVSGDEEYPAQKKLIYQGSPHGGRKGENHMTTLNKMDLVSNVAETMGITIKDALDVTDAVFTAITDAL